MIKDSQYKIKKIQKALIQIRDESAPGHEAMCECGVCSSTYLAHRTMAYLDNFLQHKDDPVQLKQQLSGQGQG